MWAMMQKFRIWAGAVNVWSAKLLMGISWRGWRGGRAARQQGIEPGRCRHNRGRTVPSGRATPAVAVVTYARIMASQWKTFQRFAENLVFKEAPKFVRQLQKPDGLPREIQMGIQQGLRMGLHAGISALAAASSPDVPALTAGRPVTRNSVPTAHRARKVVYAPDLDGRADPGEIVWTWVVYEDDPTRGKDRPVLVVGRDRRTLLGLMLSSQDRHGDDPDWVGIGGGSWDFEGRASWVRLDRVLDVPEEGIRREGAILEPEKFEMVATRLRTEYSWN